MDPAIFLDRDGTLVPDDADAGIAAAAAAGKPHPKSQHHGVKK